MQKEINKQLVSNRFAKSIDTYNKNAFVQQEMADKLCLSVKGIQNKDYNSIFEIGCGTGFLTKRLIREFKPSNLVSNDIVKNYSPVIDSIIEESIEHSNEFTHRFEDCDIESYNTSDKFDLIISNATFQWLTDIDEFFKKSYSWLKDDAILAFTTFGPENFIEIKEIENFGLDYIPFSIMQSKLQRHFDILYKSEDDNKIYFETPRDVLNHIKLTGVNGLRKEKWTKSDFQRFSEEYVARFNTDKGLSLTYNPYYYICRKK